MTKKRLEITDVHPDPNSGRRLARLLKNAAIYGFRAGPVYPLSDSAETPLALATAAVRVIDCPERGEERWQLWWVTPTGSRIYCLDEVYSHDVIEPRRLYWVEVLARLLEHGARLYRGGEMEVKG